MGTMTDSTITTSITPIILDAEPKCQGLIHHRSTEYISCNKPASVLTLCLDCYLIRDDDENCLCTNTTTYDICCRDCLKDYIAWKYAYDCGLQNSEFHERVTGNDDKGSFCEIAYKGKD